MDYYKKKIIVNKKMKAILLRVGIDKGTDGTLAPIFNNRNFEYIPLSEKNVTTLEERTFETTKGRNGVYFSEYLPERIKNRKLHFDPEFETCTYGDQTVKRNYLLKLDEDDLLVFYAGLTPYENTTHEEGLYIIGYFQVESVLDFNGLDISQKKPSANFTKTTHISNITVLKGL